jgi:outer membrane immunogenic protein
MIKKTIALVAFFALGATNVLAADVAARPYAKSPMPVAEPIHNWAGFYVGATAGYSWNRLTVNDLDYWDGLGDSSQSNHGFAGGGTVGYNWQNRALVYGIEGDISWLSNRSTSNNDLNFFAPVGAPFAQINSKIDALATIRGRIGIAVDPALLYLTGGVAFGHVKNSYVAVAVTGPQMACSGCTTWSDTDWRTGWVFGGGVESALFGNWTAKVEALYYQLSPHTVSIVPYSSGFRAGQIFSQRFDDAGLIARVGMNYKFGDGGIVARY